MKPIIQTNKHYTHYPVFVVTNGTTVRNNIVKQDDARATDNAVVQGAVVKAVFLELWVDSATASKAVTSIVYKNPAGGSNPLIGDMLNLGAYANKKNIFATHQGLVPSNGNMIPLYREWILIPKGKQRIGLGDLISFDIAAIGADVNVCGFATFKEQF